MMRVAAVGILILVVCDFVAFGGQYSESAMRLISAIKRSFG
jgi:hypothetical protein